MYEMMGMKVQELVVGLDIPALSEGENDDVGELRVQ